MVLVNAQSKDELRPWLLWALPAALLLVSGCTLGPDYERPDLTLADHWAAPLPEGAVLGSPGSWWEALDDSALLVLQRRAEEYSPTLEQAVARIGMARANLAASKAKGIPSLSASGSYTESGQGIGGSSDNADDGATFDLFQSSGWQGGLDASWELDLFGKVRRANQAAKARIAAREYDWSNARISLLAEVADLYVQFRGCEQLVQIYREQSDSQKETARLTRLSANAGFTSRADAELAEAAAASIQASLIDQRARCDLLLKSLVSLSGMPENQVRDLLAPGTAKLPQPVSLSVEAVPADLVRQRPDVASSERELAASSAEIGAAIADLFPSLSLSGSISVGGTFDQWSFGPRLSLPLFDGGSRRAGVRNARSSYDLQFGVYRETVRNAILEVEQALVRLDSARNREDEMVRSADGYQANFRAIENLYRAGSTSMIERESARRNALDAQRSLVDLKTTLLREWIALYRALGGGWEMPGELASLRTGIGPQK